MEPNKPEHPQNQQDDGDCSKHKYYVVIISNRPLSLYYSTHLSLPSFSENIDKIIYLLYYFKKYFYDKRRQEVYSHSD
jgi:hypothetical protein